MQVAETGRRSGSLLVLLGPALAVYALALLSPAIFNDSDTYWHIRAGQWMLAHHAVLTHDPFSLVLAGQHWQTQEWLSEVALAAAFQALGWSGVAVLTGLAMGAAALVLTFHVARRLDPVPSLVVAALALSCVMPDYLARPHILALPFMTAWTIGLVNAAESGRAPRWSLLPVMTIWANLHGGFLFGLALIVPLALEAIFGSPENASRARTAKHWALFGFGSVAAVLVNPFGLDGLLFPFRLMGVHSLSAIGEWQSLDLQSFSPVELAIFATLFFLLWRGVRINPLRLLLLLALIHLSLLHARYGMLLGMTAAIVLAAPVAAAIGRAGAQASVPPPLRAAAAVLAVVLAVSAALRAAWPISRVDGPMTPSQALSAVPPSLAALPVFNDYAFGGYLIFAGVKPFVDSRADFYGDAWLSNYVQVINGNPPATEALFRKYRVAWTMLTPADPLVAVLDRRPGWRRVFSGRFAVIQAGPEFAIRPARASSRTAAMDAIP